MIRIDETKMTKDRQWCRKISIYLYVIFRLDLTFKILKLNILIESIISSIIIKLLSHYRKKINCFTPYVNKYDFLFSYKKLNSLLLAANINFEKSIVSFVSKNSRRSIFNDNFVFWFARYYLKLIILFQMKLNSTFTWFWSFQEHKIFVVQNKQRWFWEAILHIYITFY